MASLTTFFCLLFLLALPSPPLLAQPVIEPITQNPNAVLLRRIWTVTGNDGDYVGQGCGPVGDINGDSISDFALHFGRAAEWRIYLGGSPAPTTNPVWIFKASIALPTPFYGDFLGNGRRFVGFGNFINVLGGAARSEQLRLFAVTDTGLATSASYILDSYARTQYIIGPDMVVGMNLDGQVGDELIVAHRGLRKVDSVTYTPEIWFYRGGAGFQVDTPSYIVYDTEPTRSSSLYTAQVVDLDGDRHFDLVTVGQYAEGYKLKLWFGIETSPWTWTKPDREITLYNTVGLYYPLFNDFDGDHKLDIAGLPGPGTINRGIYLYLSRNAPSIRDRSFLLSDAQRAFSEPDVFPQAVGSLNDSSHIVAMFGIRRPPPAPTLSAFSGSGAGPNASYDALYSAHLDGFSEGNVFTASFTDWDYTGDGWRDHLTSNSGWFGNNAGIAIILAGGPYIPLDQPTVGVRTEPMANHLRGLYLWPNPATTELNIAWRGDLSSMPTRMAVHDVNGNLVVESELRPELGSARWATDGVASGRYLLTVYDRHGKVLASTSVVVQK